MFKAFKQIPLPLQRQILYRLGYGTAIFFVTIALLFYTMELFSVLACVFIMIFFAASSFSLFRRSVAGNYAVIRGECIGIALTAVRRRTKTVTLRTEDNRILKVMIKHRLKKIQAGSKVTLYAAANTPVYENSGVHLLYSYLAIEVKSRDTKQI